ncbi:MAG: DEAD/DEAH box helicase [Bacillota bacterium]|nr:DEAD/DEAH box helicase [Bacillota bacterium]
MIELFKALNMDPSLADALKKENITVPTEIQKKVIPEALKNKDLIVQSETGTGKTLAYLLPLYKKLNTSSKEMQAIILAPTHELAMQIQRQIERLSQNSEVKVTSTPVIGNVNIERQIEALKKKPNIIVGSPGRILELIKKRKITAHTVKTVILDEADRLVDDNNLDNVKAIIKSTLNERQLMMFSATISKESEAQARNIMKEPEVIKAEGNISIPSTIQHIYFKAEQRDKIEVLRKLVRIINPPKAIVFVNEIGDTEIYTEKLKYHGFKAGCIHGSNRKLDRKRTMDEFRSGRLQLLIASDIAARGLDIEGITHVFNLNIPEQPGDYLHRVGRTGRNGNAGVAVSIVTERELAQVRKFEKALNIDIVAKDMYKGSIIDVKRNPGRR